MTINFEYLYPEENPVDLDEYFMWLTSDRDGPMSDTPGKIGIHGTAEGYEDYVSVDVLGSELMWMNETFPREKFTWYLWFESVFLVPDEMVPFLRLRWS